MNPAVTQQAEARAAESRGSSGDAIYRMVVNALKERRGPAGVLVDVGCGTGSLRPHVAGACRSYVGLDAVRYPDFPGDGEFCQVDLDAARWPVPDETADAAVSAETVEHLENPRAFFRELRRITRPGGLIVVTTPNQLSWLSLLSLVAKHQFVQFQQRPGQYPTHRTALLEIDLVRIAREVGLTEITVRYTGDGRVPGTALHWPALPGLRGRRFSDNLAVVARTPG